MIVEFKDVLKRFDSLIALDNFNIQIKEGEVYGLLGPNGSGKTTAINCMLSLLHYEKGQVYLFGEKMSQNRFDIKAKIGYVPQEIAVFEELTVYENIDFFCGLYVKDNDTRKKYVEDAIEFVDLNDFRKFYPKKLSGGLKRRLNIACGIAHKPQLIILDEPTVAVDPQSRNSILEGIKKLNKNGATVIYTTHYMEEVEQICTRISIMDKGKILISGDKYELKKLVGLSDSLILKDIEIDSSNIETIRKIDGVGKVVSQNRNLDVQIKDKMTVTKILMYLEKNNIFFQSINILSPTLNDVFLEITGRELRD
ncbi:ABC transporter ATP-binding protein [Peptostreptococcus equinus]|uniref:ABC transporter ATP-binding protein n=1 Tax=Peptostreptococcus equinus TaxID=3003601 RepID=A0ABY7JP38_9FIRM|nr:ABC transporter ATP-binding protein [Peptostreptococcus sp. CBA3647]WAW15129.1 ABC transporter ATP-binding protein [Peptostreptococcus sp. CBA3647]